MELFFVIKQRVYVVGCKFQSGTMWYGKDAIERHTEDCHKRIDNGEALTVEYAQRLSTFSWLLVAEQVEKSKAWLATMLTGSVRSGQLLTRQAQRRQAMVQDQRHQDRQRLGAQVQPLRCFGVGGAAKKSKGDQNTTTKVDMLKFFSGKRKH